MADGPGLGRQVQRVEFGTEAPGVLGSSDCLNQILEGRVSGGEIVEFDAHVEHDAVQIGVLQSVADIRSEQSSQVLYRVDRDPHRRESGSQSREPLLPRALST